MSMHRERTSGSAESKEEDLRGYPTRCVSLSPRYFTTKDKHIHVRRLLDARFQRMRLEERGDWFHSSYPNKRWGVYSSHADWSEPFVKAFNALGTPSSLVYLHSVILILLPYPQTLQSRNKIDPMKKDPRWECTLSP
jgi:hypothetical protein